MRYEVGALNNRLLCIMYMMDTGGAESMIMKLYREASRYGVFFDFLLFSEKKGFYDDEIRALGGKIFYIRDASIKKNPISFFYKFISFLNSHKYSCVLQSTEQSYFAVYALLAKLLGSKMVAIRSTNSTTCKGFTWDFISKLMVFIPRLASNVRFAPSKVAADFLFGDNSDVQILRNGISIENFIFHRSLRNRYRAELAINESLVVGHIGRFSKQKNHKFLLEIFKEITYCQQNSLLCLVGTGELKDEIKKYAVQLGVIDKVLFLGIRRDVPNVMMAMDVMIFPSFYEGMPNVVIEAQTTGLPCLVSDTITEECKVTDKVEFLSLKNSALEWANKALSMINNDTKREDYAGKMKVAGYDIKDVAKTFLNSMKLV